MLIDFKIPSLVHSLVNLQLTTNSYLNIPPHLKRVATLPCEISMLKNRNAQEVIEANCHVRLHPLKKLF